MFGLPAVTFWCVVVTVSVQIALLLIWGLRWSEVS